MNLSPRPKIKVNISDVQSDLAINAKKLDQLVDAVLELEEEICHEVSINFVDEKMICQIHDEYFSDPSVTDCISFPMDDASEICYRVLGDIYVCPKTALVYSDKHQLNPYEETTLYVVHGLLHLLGYDDLTPRKKKAMRAAEKKHMENLLVKSLYLSPKIKRNLKTSK